MPGATSLGESALGACEGIHLGKLIISHQIDILAGKWRQREEIVQVARTEEVILVTLEFIGAVGTEPQGRTLKVERRACVQDSERATAFERHADLEPCPGCGRRTCSLGKHR